MRTLRLRPARPLARRRIPYGAGYYIILYFARVEISARVAIILIFPLRPL